jgi:RNA polymerase sigma-70 factor (ECF subfamily)
MTAITSFSEQEKLFKERTGNDFSFFYKKYYQKLIYFTFKMCNDTQKAEDVTTDSFIVALEKIDKYEKGKSQFSTWLFTIAKNLMLQEIKVQKKTVSIDIEIDEEGTTLKDFIQEEEVKENLTDISYRKAEIIKDRMKELKEPYRNVLHMREIQKMAYKDIAEQLNKNLSTIKSQIRGGRAILRSQTKREFDMLDDMYL